VRKSTQVVAAELGVSFWRLKFLILSGRIARPEQLEGHGAYLWSPEDVARARTALGTVKGKFAAARRREAAGV
jgi:hypothetical protein